MAKKSKKSEDDGILDELVKVTGAKRKAGESAQDYAKRLALAIIKLDDDEWATMSEPTQVWANAAVEASDAAKAIELPPGLDDDVEDDVGEATEDDVEAEEPDDVGALNDDEAVEEPAPKAGDKKKKSGAAPAPVKTVDKKSEPKSAKGGGKKKSSNKKAAPEKLAKKAGKKVDKTASSKKAAAEPRAGTKRAKLIEMLSRAKGVSLAEIMKDFGWVSHTARGALSLLRKSGIEVEREEDGKRGNVYKIAV